MHSCDDSSVLFCGKKSKSLSFGSYYRISVTINHIEINMYDRRYCTSTINNFR